MGFQEELFEKEKGMARAASKHADKLEQARRIAEEIGIRSGYCSIEEVRDEWPGPFPTGNWCGSVFKNRDLWSFERFRRTYHEKGHAHTVAVWKYIG